MNAGERPVGEWRRGGRRSTPPPVPGLRSRASSKPDQPRGSRWHERPQPAPCYVIHAWDRLRPDHPTELWRNATATPRACRNGIRSVAFRPLDPSSDTRREARGYAAHGDRRSEKPPYVRIVPFVLFGAEERQLTRTPAAAGRETKRELPLRICALRSRGYER